MKSVRLTITVVLFVITIQVCNGQEQLEIQERWLPDVEIRSILYSEIYGLIAGSGNGIVLYDSTKSSLVPGALQNTFPVSSLFVDTNDDLWIGGLGHLRVVNAQESTNFAIAEGLGLSGRVIFSISQGNDGNIWTSCPGGAAVYRAGNWKTYTVEDGLKHGVVHDVVQAEDNSLWFATRKGGLNILGEQWQYELIDKNSRKLLKDSSGKIWVGASEGLFVKTGDTWKTYEEGVVVLPMFQDSTGNIWCIRNGVDVMVVSQEETITTYQRPLGSEVTEIYAICMGSSGSMWLSTNAGVFGCSLK